MFLENTKNISELYEDELITSITRKNKEIAKMAVLGNIEGALNTAKYYERKTAKVSISVSIIFSFHTLILAKEVKNYKYYLSSAIRVALFDLHCQNNIETAILVLQKAVDFTSANYHKDKSWNQTKRVYVIALLYLSFLCFLNNKREKALEILQKAYIEVFFLDWEHLQNKVRKIINRIEKKDTKGALKEYKKSLRGTGLGKVYKQQNKKLQTYLKTMQITFFLTESFLDYILISYNKKTLERITEINTNEILSIRRLTRKKENYLKEVRYLEDKMLPENYFDNETLQLAFKIIPAYEASGDIIDYYYNEKEDKFIAIIADVTGHGIKAASIAMVLKSYFRSLVREGWTGENLLIKISQGTEAIHKEGENICFNLIEISGRKLRVIGGGLPVILYYSVQENKIHDYELKGLPLGFPLYFYHSVKEPFSVFEKEVQPNDYLIVVSDGLLEQKIAKRDLFGIQRVKIFLLPFLIRKDPPNLLLNKFVEYWQDLAASDIPEDDATILAIKFN